MSVLIIRNDDISDVYNRTLALCYTKMTKDKLWEYVRKLELLTEDRQKLFFKIDVDISSPPSSMPELKDWCILYLNLKACYRPYSFGIIVKLLYEHFPHKVMVDYSSTDMFICSGESEDNRSLCPADLKAFYTLSRYHKKAQMDAIQISKKFKQRAIHSTQAPSILVELASEYNLVGGRWLMFFNKLDCSRWERVFDMLMEVARCNWGTVTSFNAKISSQGFIISFGNEMTMAALDRTVIEQGKKVEDDWGPRQVLNIMDRIYAPDFFGSVDMKYKPDIMSACCIQRDSIIRPTVYQVEYDIFNHNFRPAKSSVFSRFPGR